jgi:hypothetical protein
MIATELLPPMIVERLRPEDIRTVYPLMREAAPSLSMPNWLNYARRLLRDAASPKKGILVARRRNLQHPSGAVCYRQERHIAYGDMLTAEHFIALDLLYPEDVLAALLAELDKIALLLGCSAIRSIVHGRRPETIDDLKSAGHHIDGVTLTKHVPKLPRVI